MYSLKCKSLIVIVLLTAIFSTSAYSLQPQKQDADSFFNAALKDYALGNKDKAIVNLKIAAVTDPKNDSAKQLLIKVLTESAIEKENTQDYANSLKYIEEALKIEPSNENLLKSKTRLSELVKSSELLNQAAEPISDYQDEPTANTFDAKVIVLYAISFLLLFLAFVYFRKCKTLLKSINTLNEEIFRLNNDRDLLLNKLVQAKDETTRERMALMAKNLYEHNPGEALNFLNSMAENPNPVIRSNIVYSLVSIAEPETIDILLSLYTDSDQKVKGEVLKHLRELEAKIDAGDTSISDVLKHKIKYIIANEKSRKEWIF